VLWGGRAMKRESLPLRAPGKAGAIQPVKVRPKLKGSVLLGSECCVATGDGGCEAYTAIAWGVGLSHERSDIAGAEGFHSLEGNSAAPPCEVLTPCRGLRPHHVQKDRIGTWEISCLAAVVACGV